ncbi:hypothetical protein KC19_2G090100 [Ceratodon purpureus]|uniref:Uncharacterized protein n=1 Tax=Ceratodon purpureus TaxID=3225 RepID=A0A8T0IUS9_CERPU|nr:hypothetical protein KC19_2G090100 [Ceratodon purpureus]KAG0586427.1 hypothetical protein KC19_2G090100 [Ceratodon purpureus]KAG0586428.1 hypothetical protein KC19_2G090100 [Ceratodon purpureus]KAG0586429.1 hypothetical protein KC19_2G090100 [Ceratodon purpureus]KAG0586430.1 hypothetical protein KC19_2G090100 [Ceratodon purpureus]
MPRDIRYSDGVAKHPRSVEELAPWLNAVEEWRRQSSQELPPPRFLLNLLVPGAEWHWSVGAEVQRLEMEWYSGIPFPLPATPLPSEVVDSAPGSADDEKTETLGSIPPAPAPLSPPQSAAARAPVPPPHSASTAEWLRVVENAVQSCSGEIRPETQAVVQGPTSVAAAPNTSPPRAAQSTSGATLDSQHSGFPPRGDTDNSDSYDCRENMAAVFEYLEAQYGIDDRRPSLGK